MEGFTCPTVSKKVAGRAFELRMDFNALSLAEQLTGKNLLDSSVWENMDAATVTALFWACAVQGDSKLTLNEVRAAGFKYGVDMIDAVREAWRASNDVPPEDSRPTSGSKDKESTSVL